jgi:hypothetical protein
MISKPKMVLGCLVAPLIAPLVMLLIILVVGEDLRGPSYKYGLKDVLDVLGIAGMFVVLGAPIAYAVMVVLGLPFYYLARKLGVVNFWTITFGAAFVAVLPVLSLSAPNGFILYDEPEKSSLLFYLGLALCGYATGLAFWFVGGFHRPQTKGTHPFHL